MSHTVQGLQAASGRYMSINYGAPGLEIMCGGLIDAAKSLDEAIAQGGADDIRRRVAIVSIMAAAMADVSEISLDDAVGDILGVENRF